MSPDTGPRIKPALELQQVILYRLDNLDKNVGQLVTTEQLGSLERRVSTLEAEDAERERWIRQLTLASIVAAISGVISLTIAIYTGGI